MLKGKERQMVLDYLYQECMVNSHDEFVVRRKMTCKIESQLRYEHLTTKERIQIYNNVIGKKIINYLIESISNSLAMEWTNGSPQKREIRINEWAQNKYKNMPKNERVAICEKMGYKYLSN
jgi:hypothetical protein